MNHIGETVIGYMCLIDAEHELGFARGGSKVYASLDDLKRSHDCWEECGIMQVSVTLTAVLQEGRH